MFRWLPGTARYLFVALVRCQPLDNSLPTFPRQIRGALLRFLCLPNSVSLGLTLLGS